MSRQSHLLTPGFICKSAAEVYEVGTRTRTCEEALQCSRARISEKIGFTTLSLAAPLRKKKVLRLHKPKSSQPHIQNGCVYEYYIFLLGFVREVRNAPALYYSCPSRNRTCGKVRNIERQDCDEDEMPHLLPLSYYDSSSVYNSWLYLALRAGAICSLAHPEHFKCQISRPAKFNSIFFLSLFGALALPFAPQFHFFF